MSLRNLREKIFIVGYFTNSLTGSKLPSAKELLKVLFFYTRQVKLTLRESATLVIEELLIFWKKARLPTKAKQHCITKLETLHKEWGALLRDASKPSEFHKNKRMKWTEKIEELFDIAHADALNIISIEEDKEFLISQRKKGRPGFMYGIDYALDRKEHNIEIRKQNEAKRRDRSNRELNILDDTLQFASSESDTSFESPDAEAIIDPDIEIFEPPAKKSRGLKPIMTPKLAISLDYCKISDRKAVHVISAVLDSLHLNIADYIINRTSISNARQKFRKERAAHLKSMFDLNASYTICLHWDGKLLPALTGLEKVDRLPIIVSSGEREQLLEVPALHRGTGRDQADAIYKSVCEWGLQNEIQCLVFDTTVVNTGCNKGTCALIEQDLKRKLMWLPCRHHIYEIVLKSAFEQKFNHSTGPGVPIFEKFKDAWPKLKVNKWQPGMQDKFVNKCLKTSKSRVVKFINTVLKNAQPREDYKELLELALLFLDEKLVKPQNSAMIRSPGAFHHARWMGKAIYSLKIYLFREHFNLTETERIGLRQICIFIIAVYIEAWFSAPLAIQAPRTDFKFLSKLKDFEKFDKAVSQTAIKKFVNHLWYLNPETVAFALFDENVEIATKENMVAALNLEKKYTHDINRANIDKQNISNMISSGLEQFVCSKTKNFFKRFHIDSSFMILPPSEWLEQDSYKAAINKLKNLRVVNDTAERGVKLMEEYNQLLTKNEKQKQFVLQVVSDYRRRFPNSQKSTLCKEF